MKKIIALVIGIAFAFGTAGYAAAQSAAPAPATKTEKADKMAEQKAACLDKAGTDEAKKASCEKKFAKKVKSDAAKKEGAAADKK